MNLQVLQTNLKDDLKKLLHNFLHIANTTILLFVLAI